MGRVLKLSWICFLVGCMVYLPGSLIRTALAVEADVVMTNGKIITVDTKDSIVQAVAIKDGKIIAAGPNGTIKKLVGKQTRVIDLKGKTATPGLIDTHCHVTALGLGEIGEWVPLFYPEVKSIKEIVRRIGERAKRTPKGEWIIGRGFDEALLEENRMPTCWDLDAVSPDNPVRIHARCPYSVVNSYALKAAKITKDTVSPPGGTIGKDPKTGEPNGHIAYQAESLLPRAPEPKAELYEKAIRAAQAKLVSVGITATKDPGVSEGEIKAYRNLRMANELQVRINTLYNIRNKRLKEMQTLMAGWLGVYGDDTLMLTGVKISLDGSGGGRTAWLYEDWNKDYTQVDMGNKGYYRGGIPYEEFKEVLKAVHKAGLQITAHCIGDRGIDEYIKIIEEAVQAYPRKNSRHTVAHCNLSTKEAIERMKRLGDNIVIEPSSVYLYTIGDSYAAGFGPERSKRIIPLKTWLKEGLIVGNSSDYTSSDLEPWLGLYAAVTRRPLKGTYGFTPFGLDECVTIQQALRTYTTEAARCLFWEDKIGSLEAGKYADIVVWDKDMYTIPGEKLKDLKVMMTMIGGKIVYQAK